MSPKLSIIIPFYNVEKYIGECLDSVYHQDVPEDEYEVICVNDCSPDHSRDITLQYQQKHSNLILIEHEKNKMLGAARNTGLKAARGEYVWFIDSDDYIVNNVLGTIFSILNKNKVDIICFDCFRNFNEEINHFHPDSINIIEKKGITFLNEYFNNNFLIFSSSSKIISLNFLINKHFEFQEGVFFEDADLSLKLLYFASHVIYLPYSIYYYRINNNSIILSNYSGKKYADMIKVASRKIDFYKEIQNEAPLLALKIKKDGCWNATSIKKIVFLNSKERKKFYQEIQLKDNSNLIKELKGYYRFFLSYPRFTQLILFFVSPIARILKRLK